MEPWQGETGAVWARQGKIGGMEIGTRWVKNLGRAGLGAGCPRAKACIYNTQVNSTFHLFLHHLQGQ